MSIAALARAEIRDLRAYRTADPCVQGLKLNANESPLATGSLEANGLNRYPQCRPAALTQKMANHYGVPMDNLLVTRGSSEGIELLIRSFCSAGKDSVLLTPPVFEMYQVYAAVQGARIINVPLSVDNESIVDTTSLLSACDDNTKLIFICSPHNPFGSVVPRNDILRILRARAGRSIVVLDEAYIEFADTSSLASLVNEFDNLVVLRTLSKARALAGARCGAVIASSALIQLLDGILAPYALSCPVIDIAKHALSDEQLALSNEAIRKTISERERLRRELAACDAVQELWPSQANFLLARFTNLTDVVDRLGDVGIAIRIYEDDPALARCARITVSLEEDNSLLIDAIKRID